MSILNNDDKEISEVLQKEEERQRYSLILIASENYASRAVLEAQGSVLTNKYAEGYPGHRYYGGCENVDIAEELAISRLKKIYSADHANVQPHSGTQANMAAYMALLKSGDTVLSMGIANGGHLSHGCAVNFSGKLYHFIHYGVNRDTERIDYDQLNHLTREHKPRMIVTGASAYPREIDFARIAEIAGTAGVVVVADIAHIAGIVAAGLHQSPVQYCEVVTSTTHKTLRGPRGGFILCKQEYSSLIDNAVFPCVQGGPFMHIIAAKAVAFNEALKPEFKQYQQKILGNASVLAEEIQRYGLRVVTGGTDTHLILVDLTSLGITGRVAEVALGRAGISVNRNLIPFDPLSPKLTSGIRIGTPAVTSRGFGPDEMRLIAKLIFTAIKNPGDAKLLQKIREQVKQVCSSFPLPGIDD